MPIEFEPSSQSVSKISVCINPPVFYTVDWTKRTLTTNAPAMLLHVSPVYTPGVRHVYVREVQMLPESVAAKFEVADAPILIDAAIKTLVLHLEDDRAVVEIDPETGLTTLVRIPNGRLHLTEDEDEINIRFITPADLQESSRSFLPGSFVETEERALLGYRSSSPYEESIYVKPLREILPISKRHHKSVPFMQKIKFPLPKGD